jgi:hypothetical protein
MLAKNILGKPYAGKLHVRFDEGAGKSFTVLTALLYREKIKRDFFLPQISQNTQKIRRDLCEIEADVSNSNK